VKETPRAGSTGLGADTLSPEVLMMEGPTVGHWGKPWSFLREKRKWFGLEEPLRVFVEFC